MTEMMSKYQVALYEAIKAQGTFFNTYMTRSQIAAAEGLVKRGWLVKGKTEFGQKTYQVA